MQIGYSRHNAVHTAVVVQNKHQQEEKEETGILLAEAEFLI